MRFTSGLFLLVVCLPCLKSYARQQGDGLPLLDLVSAGITEHPELKGARERVEWYAQNRYGVAYFDEIDFRVGGITDERTEYAFRLKPTNPFFFAAGKSMARVLQAQAEVSLKEATEEILAERLETWLEIRQAVLALKNTRAAGEWRDQWIQNMQQYISEGDFDPEELLNVELERIDLKVEELDNEEELRLSLAKFMNGVSRPGLTVDGVVEGLQQMTFPDVSPGKLRAVVREMQSGQSMASPGLEKQELQVKETEARILMEKRDWDIGFVQPEWDNNGDDQFSLRLGIGIPLFKTNRMQLQNRQLDLIGDRWEEVKLKAEWDMETDRRQARIESAVLRLQSLDSLSSRLDSFQQGIASLDGPEARESLLRWLKAKERLRQRIIKDQFLLLSEYLEFLRLSGRLASPGAEAWFENIW